MWNYIICSVCIIEIGGVIKYVVFILRTMNWFTKNLILEVLVAEYAYWVEKPSVCHS